MFKQFFANMEFTALPLFALWLFIGLFVVAAVRVFLFKTRGDFEAQAAMPLTDGNALSEREVKP